MKKIAFYGKGGIGKSTKTGIQLPVDSIQISLQSLLQSHCDSSLRPLVKVEKRWRLLRI